MKKLPIVLAAAGGAAVAYAFRLRGRLRTWGATPSDRVRRMPGDDMVTDPACQVTQAIHINAPPADVWPWLVQIGQDRGGFYSYDWLENIVGCRIRSADRIVDEWQGLEEGDAVRLAPERKVGPDLRFEVLMADPPRGLALVTPGTPTENREAGLPYGTWSFLLDDTTYGGTHLIARARYQVCPTTRGVLMGKSLEAAQCLMQRKMLIGIMRRAEEEARHPRIIEHPGVVVGTD